MTALRILALLATIAIARPAEADQWAPLPTPIPVNSDYAHPYFIRGIATNVPLSVAT